MNRRMLMLAGAAMATTPHLVRAANATVHTNLLGLTRAEVEEIWGQLGDPVEGARMYPWDIYFIGTQRFEIYVAFQKTTDLEVAVYAELDAVSTDGLTWAEAQKTIPGMMPADAEFTESYELPPTPAGPTAIGLYRYTSASLTAAYGHTVPGEIIVALQETWHDADAEGPRTVQAISYAIRQIGQ